uniref:C3H1-type domain-containing protein n=1 Tax=Panagrolaimus sp. ES5 TaxID=591445 RepID=A0AC34FU81_9BILA
MRLYCRFGVNCWYAHGNHELRCIPVSEDLPDPTFIKKYLSFLGLPSNILDEIIQRAYSVALLFGTETKKTSSSLSSFVPTPSTSSSSLSPINNTHALPSPVDNHGQSFPAAPTTTTASVDTSESSNKFYSYFPASNGGGGSTWATDFQAAVNDAVDDNTAAADGNKVDPEDIPFSKGYNLFGNSFNLQKSW